VNADELDKSFLAAVGRISAEARETTETQAGITALERGESLHMEASGKPHQYSFDAVLRKPALLVFRMTWLPGWTARIDRGNRWRRGLRTTGRWLCGGGGAA